MTIEEVPEGLRRGRGGRPYITQPDGPPVTYTRISTLAKTFDSTFGLDKWQTRMVGLGLACRPDLVALVASHHDDKDKLGEYFEMAMHAAQSNAAANYGTAVHKFTEQLDDNLTSWAVPDELAGDLKAYEQLMSGWTVLDGEQFVVVDELQAAGTYDKRMQLTEFGITGTPKVGDIKTGRINELAVAIQLAAYAHGQHYNPATGERHDFEIDLDTGILIHLPIKTATATMYEVDLEAGWAAAKLATEARSFTSRQALTRSIAVVEAPTPPEPGMDPVLLGLIEATTVGQLLDLYHAATLAGRSPDELLPICRQRKAEILEGATT